MKPVTVRDLQWLLGKHAGPCVSIYMPTHRHRPGTEQDPVRFRHLLDRVRAQLAGREPAEVERFLAPLARLDEAPFWAHQLDGLALFRTGDELLQFQLPMSVPELAIVAEHFHVRPLIEALRTQRRYFVLSLARNSVALYQGTRDGLARVDNPELPHDLREALGLEEYGRNLGYRSGARAEKGLLVHGQGGDERKDETQRFFRAIDKALWGLLHEERVPLVLAGVGYYHPIYREVNRYPHLLSEGVEGSFEHAAAPELHKRTWPLAEAHYAQKEREVLEQWHRMIGTGRASDYLVEIAQAAAHGRVRWLITAEARQVWGRLDRASGEIEQHPDQGSGDVDLLDELSELTLLCGGEVMTLPAERMPTRSAAAAIFRY